MMILVILLLSLQYNSVKTGKRGKRYDTTGSRNVIKLYKFKTP